MKIPSVTEGDLRDFHSKHFASAPLPAVFFPENEASTVVEGDGDCLGNYDDGVKRTLTDDQIAMFRHSETRAILGGKQQETDRRTPLIESSTTKMGDTLRFGDDAIKRSRSLYVDASAARRKYKKRKRDAENTWEERKKGSDSPWQNANDEWTPRRQARELDDNKDAAVDLDYGA